MKKHTWRSLNSVLNKLTEEEVFRLLNDEINGAKRIMLLTRLHQRYSQLRTAREREELYDLIPNRIAEITKPFEVSPDVVANDSADALKQSAQADLIDSLRDQVALLKVQLNRERENSDHWRNKTQNITPKIKNINRINIDNSMNENLDYLVDMLRERRGEFAKGIIASPFHKLLDRLNSQFPEETNISHSALIYALKEAKWIDRGRIASRDYPSQKHIYIAPDDEAIKSMTKSGLRRSVEPHTTELDNDDHNTRLMRFMKLIKPN